MANRQDYISRVRQFATNEALPVIAQARSLLEEWAALGYATGITDADFPQSDDPNVPGSDIDLATFQAGVQAMEDIIGGIQPQDGGALWRLRL
jgi:hypothetical protein